MDTKNFLEFAKRTSEICFTLGTALNDFGRAMSDLSETWDNETTEETAEPQKEAKKTTKKAKTKKKKVAKKEEPKEEQENGRKELEEEIRKEAVRIAKTYSKNDAYQLINSFGAEAINQIDDKDLSDCLNLMKNFEKKETETENYDFF